MRKLERMVLSQLAKKELTQRQMGRIKGGRNTCTCGCCYVENGGSDCVDNGYANCVTNKTTTCSVISYCGGYYGC